MFTKTKKIYLLIILFGLLFLFAMPILAADSNVATNLESVAPIKINTISGLNQKVGAIIKSILGIVGALALVMVIYGGLMWMLSGGKADQVKKGKDTLVWAVAGLALIFFSYVLVNFVITAMTNTNTSNNSNTNDQCGAPLVGFRCMDTDKIDLLKYNCKTGFCPGGANIKCCKSNADILRDGEELVN